MKTIYDTWRPGDRVEYGYIPEGWVFQWNGRCYLSLPLGIPDIVRLGDFKLQTAFSALRKNGSMPRFVTLVGKLKADGKYEEWPE